MRERYRYRCPHCGSSGLRNRNTLNNWPKRYEEYRELPFYEKLYKENADIASYYCRRCQTPVRANERVDTAGSERIGSFHYGSETERV